MAMENTAPDHPSVPEASRLDRLISMFRRATRATLDATYPPQCLACREITAEPASLCGQCWRQMPFITRPFCERLGTPFAVDLGGTLLSPAAIADPPVFARARAVARYDGVARELVHKLKYSDRQELAIGMGRLMSGAAREIAPDSDVIVPVPLHWTRLWQRRFNQAAALASAMSAGCGLPVNSALLSRRKRTKRQVGLTRAERQANLQGAFHVPADARASLKGQRVLLVDDVMTTTSTANAAARVLLRNGAASVDVVTFARVVNVV